MNMKFLKQRDADAQREDIVFRACQEAGAAHVLWASVCPPQEGKGSHPLPGFMGALSSPHSFTTRKGQKFCGNPKLLWVQKYMKNLDAKQKKASTGTRVMSTTAPFWRHPANSTFI